MRFITPFSCFLLFVVLLLGSFVLWPELDMAASAYFANGEDGFILRDNWFLNMLVKVVFFSARILALGLLISIIMFTIQGKKEMGKRLCFVLLCLLIGPGLIANLVFKDNWGRARPREITAFGGTKVFSPAFYITDQCDRNCSFVSGDASFGFFLTCFAYMVSPRRRRAVFGAMIAVGSLFAGARLLLGAHFLSDILTAAFMVMGVNAGLYILFYGQEKTKDFWRGFFRCRVAQ